jgi:DNA primase
MSERIPESTIDEVLARTDLVAVVQPYVQLTRKAGRFFGNCPFHKEKTPSFSVSPERGLFYCFGCGAGGSAIQFLMRAEGWSFPEAVRSLAKRAGVALPEPGTGPDQREARRRRDARDAYHRLLELATEFYEAQLSGGRYAAAVSYLSQRGVDEATARTFRLGYAPPGWQGLLDGLGKKGISGAEVERAGLAIARKGGGGYYDRFRDRIMFPVIDRMGHVVAFSGRALGSVESQKYVNSPELPFFKKGEQLYGLHAAKAHLRRDREAVLVEGNFDVVTLHAAGLRTTMAPLGTALTEQQLRLLRHLSDRCVLLFDGDEAGQKAMLRCLGPAYRAQVMVRAAQLPEGEDPDSYVRRHGTDALSEILERARPLAELAIDQIVAPAVGAPPEERLVAVEGVGEVLAHVGEAAVRRHYVEEVSRRLELAKREVVGILRRQARQRRRRASAGGDETERAAEGTLQAAAERRLRLTDRERLLVQLSVDRPDLAVRFAELEAGAHMVSAGVRHFVTSVAAHWAEREAEARMERLVDDLEAGLRGAVLEALAADREYRSGESEALYEEVVWQLQVAFVRRQKRKLAEQLRAAEHSGNDERFAELADRDRRLNRQLRELQQLPRQQPST